MIISSTVVEYINGYEKFMTLFNISKDQRDDDAK